MNEDWAERTIIQQVPAIERRRTAREDWAHYLAYAGTDRASAVERIRLSTVPVRIGRRAPCDIILADAEVSALHCEVRVQGSDVIVTDLGSTNGTFVDGRRAAPRMRLKSGATLQLGRHRFKLETRDRFEFAEAQELQRDLARAQHYVRSMLPAPLTEGPLRVDWLFEPSAQVGGDGFGYSALDEHRVLGYLVDVSGHGVGAAMHLVSVLNTLRQRALPDTDFANPAQVLSRLNAIFQMDLHANLIFSIWLGVLDLRSHRLDFASAGHHPAYLAPGGAGACLAPLHTPRPPIDALEQVNFISASAVLRPGDSLYLFSDGVFEITTIEGDPWSLDKFLAMLQLHAAPQPSAIRPPLSVPRRLYEEVRRIARPGPLEDDFSLLEIRLT